MLMVHVSNFGFLAYFWPLIPFRELLELYSFGSGLFGLSHQVI